MTLSQVDLERFSNAVESKSCIYVALAAVYSNHLLKVYLQKQLHHLCGQEPNCAVMSSFGGNLQAGLLLVTTDADFNQPCKGYHTVRMFRRGNAHIYT